MAKHKHCELIHAWAEGAEIEYKGKKDALWCSTSAPQWDSLAFDFRIKPQETPWYENIPPHGVLCWVSDTIENPDEDSAIAIVMHKSNVYVTHKPSTWTYATPLTNDEIKQFLRGEQ